MRVRIPGSTANLGPGFDVLGIALDRYLMLSNQPSESASAVPFDGLARIAARQAGHDVEMFADTEIPVGKGFGSSAAEAVGGAFLARLVAGDPESDALDRAFQVACDIEGHPDNAAPSAFGGMCLSVGDTLHRIEPRLDGLRLMLWVPDSRNDTKSARGIVRQNLELSDVTVQAASCAAVVAGFALGRLELIAECVNDRIHEQARLAGLPETKRAIEALRECGYAAWLSGSGPAVVCIAEIAEVDNCAIAMGSVGDLEQVTIDLVGCTLVDE